MRQFMRSDYYAQVDNGDPFAPPAWRSPVYRTPEWLIMTVQFGRTLWSLIRFIIRHPLLDLTIAVTAFIGVKAGLAWRCSAGSSWPG
jgi:hypothetical protein